MPFCDGRLHLPCLFGLPCPHKRTLDWCFEHNFDQKTRKLVLELINIRKSVLENQNSPKKVDLRCLACPL